jgi:hypothetical protein
LKRARVALSAALIAAAIVPVSAAKSFGAFAPAVHDEQNPSVAYDPVHGSFLVVAAADDGRVYGSRVAGTGKVIGAPIAISSAESATRPAVVWDGASFLVVWQAAIAGCDHDIRASRVSAGGRLLQVGIAISPCAGDQNQPAVATGASSSLIVWSDGGISDRTFAPATGVGAITQLAATGTDPAVSWNGTEYLAVWSDGGDVLGDVLDPQGSPRAVDFAVAVGGNTQLEPALASDGSNWLVTWTELTSTYDVMGVRVDAGGGMLGPPVAISAVDLDQGTSAVAFDGTNFVVVWNDSRNDPSGATYDVFAARISAPTGVVIDQSGVPVSVAPGQQGSPAVAWGASQYFSVWQDNRNGLYDVYGARVTAGTTVIDPFGFEVFAAPAATDATVTLALDKTSIRADGREVATLTVDASTTNGPLANGTVRLVPVWSTPWSPGAMKFLPSASVVLDPNGHATVTVYSLRSGSASIVASVSTRPYSGTEFIALEARRHSVVVFANGAASYLTCDLPATCVDPAYPVDPFNAMKSIRAELAGKHFTDADMPYFSYAGGLVNAISHDWQPNASTCADSGQPYVKSISLMRSMVRAIAAANPNTDFSLVGLSQGGLMVFQMLGVLTTPLPKGSRLEHVITLDAPLGGLPSDLGQDFANLYPGLLGCFFQGGNRLGPPSAATSLAALWDTTDPNQGIFQGDNATVMCKFVGYRSCATLGTNQQLVLARPDVDVDTWGSSTDRVFYPLAKPECTDRQGTDALSSQVVTNGRAGFVDAYYSSGDPYVYPPDPGGCETIFTHTRIVFDRAHTIAETIGLQQ